jgi:hypothetical protein
MLGAKTVAVSRGKPLAPAIQQAQASSLAMAMTVGIVGEALLKS